MARFLPYICFILLILLLCIKAQAGRLGPTPDDEVEALREIAGQLRKKDMNFSVDPCIYHASINDTSSATPQPDSNFWPLLYNNSVICNCSYPGGVCHVQSIFFKGQDLAGTLPSALVKLPYLKKIDLNRNYLSGTIPREWASTHLEFLSISANNLTGRVDYLGKITTLKALSIESNLFSGPVPPELGHLDDMEILILNANNLEGVLPTTLTNLTKLKELRISSNNFTGRIPDFFRSWKQLQKLEIQASGLEGPIPFSISVLSNLTELISDLIGEGSHFPPLHNMGGLVKLMLRSCSISGPISTYISKMEKLKKLDLSFNRLEGRIPNFGHYARNLNS